jgi:peptidoglycan/LPS O-acetylase OafA/YrhL
MRSVSASLEPHGRLRRRRIASLEPVSKDLTSSGYMPQLDSLRAIAVSAVLVHHLLDAKYLPRIVADLSPGLMGVKLFFVLSGFLITGILLRARPAQHAAAWHVTRQFYIRRFLRIFPLYYFALAFMLLLGVQAVYEHKWSLLTYTFNLAVAYQGWFPDTVAHFWSLAVEEQFYLLWPFLILFAPRRWLLRCTIAVALIGPLYRGYAKAVDLNGIALYTVTFASLDALAIGAVVAILANGRPAPAPLRHRLRRFVLPCAALSALGLLVTSSMNSAGDFAYTALFDTAVALLFGSVVAGASSGIGGLVGRLLDQRWLQYCGRLAYGLYVYHLLLSEPVYAAGTALGVSWSHGEPIYFAAASIATFIVAALSWHLLEEPINALKDRFAYSATGKRTSGGDRLSSMRR